MCPCAVGMLIELMAGKAAALKACCYDATPFTFTEHDDPITYFGHCLRKGLLAESCTINSLSAFCCRSLFYNISLHHHFFLTSADLFVATKPYKLVHHHNSPYTHYQALGPELIPVYGQSAHRCISHPLR